MNGAKVGILEKSNEVCFCCFLQRKYGGTLEPKIGFVILSNFANKTLEGKFANEQIGTLLEFANFTKSDSTYRISENTW